MPTRLKDNGLPPVRKPPLVSYDVFDIGVWLQNPEPPDQLLAQTVAVGKSLLRPARLATLVTSGALRLRVITPPDEPLGLGQLLITESTEVGPELARVEREEPIYYGEQIREVKPEFEKDFTPYRWLYCSGIWSTRKVCLRLNGAGRLGVSTKRDALARLAKYREAFFKTPLRAEQTLSPHDGQAQQAKWLSLKDWHSAAVRELEVAWQAETDQSEKLKHLEVAAKQFAVDFDSYWRWALPPVTDFGGDQRRSAQRRKFTTNDAGRYLAMRWCKDKLHRLTAEQLAQRLNADLGTNLTTEAVRVIRKRLELWVDWEGCPDNVVAPPLTCIQI